MKLSNRKQQAIVRLASRARIAGFASMLILALASVTIAAPTGAAHGARATEYYPPPDSSGGWRALHDATSIRKLAGMDLARLDQAWDFTQRCSQNGGLVVVRHGYLVYEKYYGRAHRNANPDMA